MKNLIKKNYKYLIFVSFVFFVLFFNLHSQNIFGQVVPYISITNNNNSGSVSWTSNMTNAEASCTLFKTKFQNGTQDILLNKTLIHASGGSVNYPIGDFGVYFFVIDCMVDRSPWVIHSNTIVIDKGGHDGQNWFSSKNPPTATDLVRVFGIRNLSMAGNEQLAPFNNPEDPTIFAWYVQYFNGYVPTYDNGNLNCTFTHPDGTVENYPENIIKVDLEKNFNATVSCKNIMSLDQPGGEHGIQTYVNSSNSLYVRVRQNPNYNQVLVSPNPPLIPFGGSSIIKYKSYGDFCKISEDPPQGSVPNFDAGWGATQKSASGGFPVWGFSKQANFKVACYTEHTCVGVKTTNNAQCSVAKTQNDCFNITTDTGTKLCNWGSLGGQAGTTNPTPVFLKAANAVVRMYNFSLDMMGQAWIVDTKTTKEENVTDTTATLTGEMNPGGDDELHAANAYFRYTLVDKFPPIFCNDIFGSNMLSTDQVVVGPAKTVQKVSSTVGNLYPNTTYYYCIVGSNDNQITYGGVKSFTTKMTDPDINGDPNPSFYSDKISAETKAATVIDSNSAFLKGSFNTEISASTWFEYKKKNIGLEQTNSISLNKGFLNSIFSFFKAKKALALNTIFQWKKVGEKERFPNTNGNFSYVLKELSPSTAYEFRAVIKDKRFLNVKYGDILTFTTKSRSSTEPGGNGIGGVPYEDPCNNPEDVNCNGTGGEGIRPQEIISLPDLTTSATGLSSYVVNTPTVLSALIINKGNVSTNPALNIQRVSPTSIPTRNTIPKNPLENIKLKVSAEEVSKADTRIERGGSFLRNLFKIDTAVAITTDSNSFYPTIKTKASTGGVNDTATKIPLAPVNYIAPVSSKDTPVKNFYNFFQVSTREQSSTDSATGIDSSIVNFPPVLMETLDPKSSRTMNQNYTFTSVGTYYIRACADKKSPIDAGLIKESYEDNNCGPWSKIVISLDGSENIDTGEDNNNDGNGDVITTDPTDLVLGQTATPPDLAIVRYHEGIETVLHRQIIANLEMAESYGYKEGDDLQAFAWQLSDYLARKFGYVGKNGKEIRVSQPDIAAYQLYMKDGVLTIYEYYDGKIVNIQKITNAIRNIYKYEYYFKRVVNKVF